ncbi:MAG: anhydro-N-acetylmuramic acid kinase [Parvularculaceae bacterium]
MRVAEILTAIGLMSGTSLDGVDAALLRADGERVAEFGPADVTPYAAETRDIIQAATRAALEGRLNAPEIAEAAKAVTRDHIEAVRAFMTAHGLAPREIDVIGFHGQTILHRPAQGRPGEGVTIQIGDGQALADALGIDVVADFRRADIAAGGEGAPLAPIYHRALAAPLAEARRAPVVVFNLGGVANVTYVAPGARGADLLAFDSGPGNGMIDLWVRQKTGAAMDEDGKLAAMGQADAARLRRLMDHDFFRRPPPKSLDRYDFALDFVSDLSIEDGAATLAAFTAEALAAARAHFPARPALWVACGGGRRNPSLMAAIAARLGDVVAAEEVGWRGDDIEAEAFAFLAIRHLKGLPISFPKTTGAPEPLTGGRLFRAR